MKIRKLICKKEDSFVFFFNMKDAEKYVSDESRGLNSHIRKIEKGERRQGARYKNAEWFVEYLSPEEHFSKLNFRTLQIDNEVFGDYLVFDDGRIYSNITSSFISPTLDTNTGYLLSTIGGKTRRRHRIIIESFFGWDERQVNHIDGDKTNNRLSNLEYSTSIENIRHSIDVLNSRRFSRKISYDDIIKIHNRIVSGDTIKKIAEDYNVSRDTISNNHKKYLKELGVMP